MHFSTCYGFIHTFHYFLLYVLSLLSLVWYFWILISAVLDSGINYYCSSTAWEVFLCKVGIPTFARTFCWKYVDTLASVRPKLTRAQYRSWHQKRSLLAHKFPRRVQKRRRNGLPSHLSRPNSGRSVYTPGSRREICSRENSVLLWCFVGASYLHGYFWANAASIWAPSIFHPYRNQPRSTPLCRT